MSDQDSSGGVMMAFVSGALLGTVAAILLAPQSGSESRDRLRGYAKRTEDDLRGYAGRAGDALEEIISEGKEFVDAKKSVLREAFEAGRDAMKEEREKWQG